MPVCLASFKSIPHLDSSPQKLCASFFYFISLGMFLTNRVIFPIYFVPFWKSLVAERFTRKKCVNTPHSIKWVRSCESKRFIYIYIRRCINLYSRRDLYRWTTWIQIHLRLLSMHWVNATLYHCKFQHSMKYIRQCSVLSGPHYRMPNVKVSKWIRMYATLKWKCSKQLITVCKLDI